jgi:hypothetical protein
MAGYERKRKRRADAITVYRGDDDDDDELPMNRDLTFSRPHGRLAQSSSAIPAENSTPPQSTEMPGFFDWFDEHEDIPNPEDVPATGSKEKTKEKAKEDMVCR